MTTLEGLTSDVINDIFARVNDDAKFLTQCLLMSKRMASHLRLVSSVSIKIHHPRQNHFKLNNRDWIGLRYKLIGPSSQHDDNLASRCELFMFGKYARYFNCKAREALHPFSKLDTAIIFNEYFGFDTLGWMVEYSGGVNFIKSCAFLTAINNPKGNNKNEFYKVDGRKINSWVASLFRTAFIFLPMLAQMVHDHENLRDILVTEPSRNGWIHAGEDEIVKTRQAGGSADKLMKMMTEVEMHMKVKVWYVSIPNESTVYRFVVLSSPDNIDQEVKAATRRFWAGHRVDVIQEAGIKIKIMEVVETRPCNLEYDWVSNFERAIMGKEKES